MVDQYPKENGISVAAVAPKPIVNGNKRPAASPEPGHSSSNDENPSTSVVALRQVDFQCLFQFIIFSTKYENIPNKHSIYH